MRGSSQARAAPLPKGISATTVALVTTALRAAGDEGLSAKDRAFYQGKVAAARFFVRGQLPKIAAERAIAEATDNALMDLDEAAF